MTSARKESELETDTYDARSKRDFAVVEKLFSFGLYRLGGKHHECITIKKSREKLRYLSFASLIRYPYRIEIHQRDSTTICTSSYLCCT